MDFRNSKLDERYKNDATFHAIVQAMYKMIQDHGITPSEMREALFLAHYKFEMENPQQINRFVMMRMDEFWKGTK